MRAAHDRRESKCYRTSSAWSPGASPSWAASWSSGGAVSLGLAIKDETRGGAQIAGAISTIAGGAIIIAAAVYFGQLDTSWMPN